MDVIGAHNRTCPHCEVSVINLSICDISKFDGCLFRAVLEIAVEGHSSIRL